MSQLDSATLRVEEPAATMQVVEDVTPAPAPAPAPEASPDEWVVEPGDSFWSIAEDVVADRLGRPGSEPEVATYWARLVDANRSTLASGDPDLIYPGERMLLVG
jgi:nucleoid-associated protein YgaU